jgi:hypothetical protein
MKIVTAFDDHAHRKPSFSLIDAQHFGKVFVDRS